MSLKTHLRVTVGSVVFVVVLMLLLGVLTNVSEIFGYIGAVVALVYIPIFFSLAVSLCWRSVSRRRN